MRPIDYKKRLETLRDEMAKAHLDAFFVSDETNVSYLSGFSGHDSFLFVTEDKSFFLTDSRYIEEAEEETEGFEMALVKVSTYITLTETVGKSGSERIGFESMNLPYEVAAQLKKMIGASRLVAMKDLVNSMREVKDGEEIGLIKSAIRVTRNILDKTVKSIKVGVSEKVLSKNIEIEFMKGGAGSAFQPIVASGENSSKPHAQPTDKKIEKNSFVEIDLGAKLDGYNSDMTRMVFLGKVPDKIKRIYKIVHEAQGKAIAKIKPGVRISEIDAAARNHIKEKGFGKYFAHSLGHGVGMSVHEKPTVWKGNTDLLKSGMVFTVEPAIYIPKFGGVRIEDMVSVTDDGCEILTR